MRLGEGMGCQGGATRGYQRAGWHVTSIDIAARHAKYSPADRHVVGDVLPFIRAHGTEFDAWHVSPPCQYYTRGNAPRRGQPSKWPRLIPELRELLDATGKPYVIENVCDAAWDMRDPVRLCGCMWDLSTIDSDGVRIHLQRPRLFEAGGGWSLTAPRPCDHSTHEWVAGAYGGARRDKHEAKYVRKGGYVPPDKDVVLALLGFPDGTRMTWEGLYESLPPAYTEHIGNQLKEVI